MFKNQNEIDPLSLSKSTKWNFSYMHKGVCAPTLYTIDTKCSILNSVQYIRSVARVPSNCAIRVYLRLVLFLL